MKYPKPWLAAVLNLILQPLGMLYVGRGGLAAIYFLGFGVLAGIDFLIPNTLTPILDLIGLALLLVSVVHAYHLAKRTSPDAPRRKYSTWQGMLCIVAVFVAFACIFRAFLFEPFRIPAGSMRPTLDIGNHVVVQKWGYGHYSAYGIPFFRTQPSAPIDRGDIIVFDYPPNPSLQYIKRVVGLPGDVISIKGRDIAINGQKVPTQKTGEYLIRDTDSALDQYIERLGDTSYAILQERKTFPTFVQPIVTFAARENCTYSPTEIRCEVPAQSYFVLGDNRDNSQDSRYWGFVPVANVLGKVIYITR